MTDASSTDWGHQSDESHSLLIRREIDRLTVSARGDASASTSILAGVEGTGASEIAILGFDGVEDIYKSTYIALSLKLGGDLLHFLQQA